MSEPEVEWFIERIQEMLREIDVLLTHNRNITNSIREIIMSNTNEIEIKLHTIIRKLKGK